VGLERNPFTVWGIQVHTLCLHLARDSGTIRPSVCYVTLTSVTVYTTHVRTLQQISVSVLVSVFGPAAQTSARAVSPRLLYTDHLLSAQLILLLEANSSKNAIRTISRPLVSRTRPRRDLSCCLQLFPPSHRPIARCACPPE
jgi:hypothetical protein